MHADSISLTQYLISQAFHRNRKYGKELEQGRFIHNPFLLFTTTQIHVCHFWTVSNYKI